MWILPDQLSSEFVEASGCSKKPLSSFFPGPILFAVLSGKVLPTPHTWLGWKKKAWSHILFGSATLQGSDWTAFVDWWTSSLPASHVRPTPSPATRMGTSTTGAGELETDPCRIASGSFPSVAPPWCSSKTLQLGFDLASDTFNLSARNYADWVTRSLSLSLSLRQTLEQRTIERGCLSWHTPRAHEAGDWTRDNGVVGQERLSLSGQAGQWPTPNAGQFNDGEDPENWERRRQENLAKGINGNGQGTPLAIAATKWPTPNTPSGGGRTTNVGGYSEDGRRQKKSGKTTLNLQVDQWPTPQAKDFRSGETLQEYGNSRPLNEAALKFSHPVPVLTTSGEKLSETRRILRPRLNPAFVCWLMGWPTFWTRAEPISCGARVTESWRCKLRSLLLSYFGERNF